MEYSSCSNNRGKKRFRSDDSTSSFNCANQPNLPSTSTGQPAKRMKWLYTIDESDSTLREVQVLRVRNLDSDFTYQDIISIFHLFGTISKLHMHTTADGRFTGVADIKYKQPTVMQTAAKMINELDTLPFVEAEVIVNYDMFGD